MARIGPIVLKPGEATTVITRDTMISMIMPFLIDGYKGKEITLYPEIDFYIVDKDGNFLPTIYDLGVFKIDFNSPIFDHRSVAFQMNLIIGPNKQPRWKELTVGN